MRLKAHHHPRRQARGSRRVVAGGNIIHAEGVPWRLAISKADLNNSKPPGEIQAAKVARVSAASGSFEGFRVEGEVADAKSSKLAAGASRPRAKI